MQVTIYKNLFDKQPYYIPLEKAIERIRKGNSKNAVTEIRTMIDKDRASKLKQNLPSICFSGVFKERKDGALEKHSGYIVLDFDEIKDIGAQQKTIVAHPFVYACWLSPSGNGLKALVKIADGNKHRQHFAALQEYFPQVDKSGVNESRVCFESYDPDIYVNDKAVAFDKVKTEQYVIDKPSESAVFNNLLKWLANRGDSFKTGERNRFIFLLAAACCRYGLDESFAVEEIINRFPFSNDFTMNEAVGTIKSAYRASSFASATFEQERLVDKMSKVEVTVDASVYDESVKPADVIFGEDVKSNAIDIYERGYEQVRGIGIADIDERWRMKRGELTCLTGIGNYGKSTFMKWYLIMRAIRYGEKFAMFAPEDNPAHEFYHECAEIYLGASCLPNAIDRPTFDKFNEAYDFVSNHFFFIHPKEKTPTPKYVKERFLELIVKNQVDGCIIDPFNQMSNDYGNYGGRSDKYLEFILSDLTQFSRENNVYLLIVAHPHKMMKDGTGNYPCPDVFDLADGAMWNNKCDNIIVFHRTNFQKNPDGNECEFHSKKIRRQRTVGKRGVSNFQYNKARRRFTFQSADPLDTPINNQPKRDGWRPVEAWYNKD